MLFIKSKLPVISLQLIKITGKKKSKLPDNLEEWDRVGGGREAQEGGDICIPMDDIVLINGRN